MGRNTFGLQFAVYYLLLTVQWQWKKEGEKNNKNKKSEIF